MIQGGDPLGIARTLHAPCFLGAQRRNTHALAALLAVRSLTLCAAGTGKGGESIFGKTFPDEISEQLTFQARGMLG